MIGLSATDQHEERTQRRARTETLDELDLRIIQALRHDGRAQSTSIAEEIGVSGNLVAGRIRAMEATGLMRVVAIADFRVHGFRMLARIRLKAQGRAPGAIAADLAAREHVLAVHLTSGRYQVSCLHAFTSAREMIEAAREISQGIAGVEDVDVELLNNVFRYAPDLGPIELEL